MSVEGQEAMQQVVQDAMAGMSVQGQGGRGQDAEAVDHEAAEEGGVGGPGAVEDAGNSSLNSRSRL